MGKGCAWYIGTVPEKDYLMKNLRERCTEKGIYPILPPVANVEVTQRIKDDKEYIFILNHGDNDQTIQIDKPYLSLLTEMSYEKKDNIIIPGKGVIILEGSL